MKIPYKHIKLAPPAPMVDPVTISQKQYEYFLSALTYARKHGFKITIFNENGKPIALQG